MGSFLYHPMHMHFPNGFTVWVEGSLFYFIFLFYFFVIFWWMPIVFLLFRLHKCLGSLTMPIRYPSTTDHSSFYVSVPLLYYFLMMNSSFFLIILMITFSFLFRYVVFQILCCYWLQSFFFFLWKQHSSCLNVYCSL